VRRELLDIARCPVCRAERSLDLRVDAEDAREVRAGSLRCRRCGAERTISGGIVDLMPDAPGFVRREAAGLDRFADVMRASGWDRERVLNLPYEQSGYWFAQATAMHQTLAQTPLQPGQRLLDVGSNTCWASAMFAERGLDVIALDINAGELQGLATADWWFEGKGVYFERMLGLMFDLSLADASVDWVWCCEVLHHNHRENLGRTFAELHRVLRPGGAVLVVNETLRSLRDPKLHPGREVAEFEGHEHAYVRRSYLAAARAAGFELELRFPWIHPIFGQEVFGITREMSVAQGFRAAAAHAVRRVEPLRRAYLAWKAYVLGGTSLYLVARKPARGASGAPLP
jgi:SAM-dependent methyltransferase